MKRTTILLGAVSLLLAGADFFYDKHGHFPFERWPGFHGLVVLVGGGLLVLLASGAGALLRRKEAEDE